MNCGFEKAEHLAPNIGYVKFNFFADPDTCAPTAVAAMNFIADSDAVIFDLRLPAGEHIQWPVTALTTTSRSTCRSHAR